MPEGVLDIQDAYDLFMHKGSVCSDVVRTLGKKPADGDTKTLVAWI